MKFGKILKQHTLLDGQWAYIDYKGLKRAICLAQACALLLGAKQIYAAAPMLPPEGVGVEFQRCRSRCMFVHLREPRRTQGYSKDTCMYSHACEKWSACIIRRWCFWEK
eukprot:5474846-Pleurochrysis_carterae.AAC.2